MAHKPRTVQIVRRRLLIASMIGGLLAAGAAAAAYASDHLSSEQAWIYAAIGATLTFMSTVVSLMAGTAMLPAEAADEPDEEVLDDRQSLAKLEDIPTSRRRRWWVGKGARDYPSATRPVAALRNTAMPIAIMALSIGVAWKASHIYASDWIVAIAGLSSLASGVVVMLVLRGVFGLFYPRYGWQLVATRQHSYGWGGGSYTTSEVIIPVRNRPGRGFDLVLAYTIATAAGILVGQDDVAVGIALAGAVLVLCLYPAAYVEESLYAAGMRTLLVIGVPAAAAGATVLLLPSAPLTPGGLVVPTAIAMATLILLPAAIRRQHEAGPGIWELGILAVGVAFAFLTNLWQWAVVGALGFFAAVVYSWVAIANALFPAYGVFRRSKWQGHWERPGASW